MLPSERRKKIVELLEKTDVITINEFIHTFDISIETLRRDLNLLENQDKIEKVYGGARLRTTTFNEPAMDLRMISKQELKNTIGKTCSALINDGDCIYLDSGSTTYHIAKHIKDKHNLTVITNSIPIVNELSNTDIEIIVLGGRFRKGERSVVSFNYLFDFNKLNIQKSFICAGGISVENGISDYNMSEVETRKLIMGRSKEIIIVSDSSKFGKDVLFNVSTLDAIDTIVTDDQLDPLQMHAFKQTFQNLIIASSDIRKKN